MLEWLFEMRNLVSEITAKFSNLCQLLRQYRAIIVRYIGRILGQWTAADDWSFVIYHLLQEMVNLLGNLL